MVQGRERERDLVYSAVTELGSTTKSPESPGQWRDPRVTQHLHSSIHAGAKSLVVTQLLSGLP